MEKREFNTEKTIAIKGFAVAVMLFHHCFFSQSIYSGFSVNFFPFMEDYVNNVALFGKLCVGTFAFLSGYGLSIKWKECNLTATDRKRYFITRYIKTISGYWFVFFVCCIVAQFVDGRTHSTYFTGTVLTNVFDFCVSFLGISRIMGTPMLIYEWWYMSAAVLFILLVPVFCESIKRVGALATIAWAVVLPRIFGIEFMGGTQPFSFIFPVLLGVLFQEERLFEAIREKITGRFHGIPGMICSVILYACMCFLAYKLYRRLSFDQYWEIKYGIVPVIVIVCLNETIMRLPWVTKMLAGLGKHSMNMYLVHMMFLTYLKEFIFAERHFLVSWSILMGLSFGASIVFEAVKKHICWNRMMDRLFLP